METINSKTVVLGVAAHPDDLEFTASGSFAKWARTGAGCYYLICTDGSKGSNDPTMTEEKLVKIRRQEQKKAAKILGLNDVFFLNHKDTEIVADLVLKKEIVYYLRLLKPDIVVTLDPTFIYSIKYGYINHTDHRAVGIATLDAVYPLSRDRLTFPEHEAAGAKPHKVKYLYLVSFENPTEIVDISETFELKVKALKAHKSQIGTKAVNRIASRATLLGKKYGLRYAEGFIKLNLPD